MNYMNQTQGIVLTGITAELSGKTFNATGSEFVIGRQTGCQIQIDHAKISRQHARITNIGGQWLVNDLNSANGTFINGNRIINNSPIRVGDRLGLGNYEFLFSVEGGNNATLLDTPAYGNQPVIPQTPPQQGFPPMPAAPQQSNQVYTPPMPAPAIPQSNQPAQAAPVYIPISEPKKKRRPCLIIAIILILLACLGTVIAGVIFWDDILDQLGLGIISTSIANNTSSETITGKDAVLINSTQGGVVTSDVGAGLVIPPGAVPPTDDGSPGEMTFSVNKASGRTVSMSNGLEGIGDVYEFGPDGFTFSAPVTLVLPIPSGVDPGTVAGATYYNENTGVWEAIPAVINTENRTATVSTTHFSPWSLFRNTNSNQSNGGIKVTNAHHYDTGTYPPSTGSKPYTVSYGVCIESYTLDNPNDSMAWSHPQNWTMTVESFRTSMVGYSSPTEAKWSLPPGTYNLIEVWHFSEVNHTVLDSPQYDSYWAPYGQVTLTNNSVAEFTYSESAFLSHNNLTMGRPNCFGAQDTSVGTGDVQVTLTWNTSVDLDLYVEGPDGETVSYSYTPSTSGGTLDRDNQCADFILGRPENIFWPQGQAPSGTYTVSVDYFGSCESTQPAAFTVRIVVQGQVKTYEGTIASGDSAHTVATFTVP